jgi:hypothetical protein
MSFVDSGLRFLVHQWFKFIIFESGFVTSLENVRPRLLTYEDAIRQTLTKAGLPAAENARGEEERARNIAVYIRCCRSFWLTLLEPMARDILTWPEVLVFDRRLCPTLFNEYKYRQ